MMVSCSTYAASRSSTVVYKGQLISHQIPLFYRDLTDPRLTSALVMVHQRFSTNTFPSWDRAHPYRFLSHNGEINTLRGNINWMRARERQFASALFGEDIKKVLPIVESNGSDSAVVRQLSRTAGAHRSFVGACRDDDDSRGMAERQADG